MKSNSSSFTLRTSPTERRIVSKFAGYLKALLKLLRPCRNKKKTSKNTEKPNSDINQHNYSAF